MTQRQIISLGGCRTEPLASYLKSIGVARLVYQQADPTVRVWFDGCAHLDTVLTEEQLTDFVVFSYRPTPIINPWNNGSGFGANDVNASKSAYAALSAIESSNDQRLANYRTSIEVARAVLQRDGWDDLAKEQQAAALRNNLPDAAVEWIDAAIVLTSTSRTFPPLLGTGGNDGRLDFSSAFMQRVGELFGLAEKPIKPAEVHKLAADALYGTRTGKLRPDSLGQFDPLASGGPRSAPAGKANSLANPWDAVLMFEGAVAFASGVARRFGSHHNVSSIPFTVRAAPEGFASAAAENSRGEFWAPVWHNPSWYPDVAHMLREGRVEYNGAQARNGLDAALALATLGVDRGIDEFVRYAFIERNGLATFAVPVDRIEVTTNMSASLLANVNTWLNRFRGDHLPTSVTSLVRSAHQTMYAIAGVDEGKSQPLLLELLTTIATLDQLAARSRNTRDSVQRSPGGLAAIDWLPALNDKSDEFKVALSLASWREPNNASGIIRQATHPGWEGRRAPVEGFGRRPLDHVLGDVLAWWSHKAEVDRFGRGDKADKNAWGGVVTALWCDADAFAQLASGQLDLARLESILSALMMLDFRRVGLGRQDTPDNESLATLASSSNKKDEDPTTYDATFTSPEGEEETLEVEPNKHPGVLWRVPAWVAAIKLCFHHRSAKAVLDCGSLVATTPMARHVQTRHLDEAVAEATHRLRVAGLEPLFDSGHTRPSSDPDFPIATALLTPVSDAAIRVLAKQTCAQRETAPA